MVGQLARQLQRQGFPFGLPTWCGGGRHRDKGLEFSLDGGDIGVGQLLELANLQLAVADELVPIVPAPLLFGDKLFAQLRSCKRL